MLRFFRIIRKKLIEEDNVRKPASPAGRYLLYAIGEILLVVIGILIALQINNWNENQKKEQIQREYTSSMIEDLKQDLTYIKAIRTYNSEQLEELDSLSLVIETDQPDIRGLTEMSFTVNLNILSDLNNSTFSALINSGSIDLYEKEIRDKLIRHQGLQENYMQSYELNQKVFYETMNTYLQTFPILSFLPDKMTEQVWDDLDLSQVAISFNVLIQQKRFLLEAFEDRYIQLEKSTMEILQLLEGDSL